MAEMYAHERLARQAAEQMEAEPFLYLNFSSYLVGANGPDILFYHKAWLGGGKQHLGKLGSRMHRERTDRFLEALVRAAHTDAQKAYAMGFLCHFALDSALHPYVYAMSQKGAPFAMKGGHGYLEEAIDSMFYLQDTNQNGGLEPNLGQLGVFLVTEQEEREIGEVLAAAVRQAFDGLDIPAAQFALSIAHTRTVKRALRHPNPVKRGLLHAVESVLHLNCLITSHCSPLALPAEDFMNLSHHKWAEVEAPEVPRRESVPELFEKGKENAIALMDCARAFWKGEGHMQELTAFTQNRSYACDLPGSAKE